jgi:hypothetical protein
MKGTRKLIDQRVYPDNDTEKKLYTTKEIAELSKVDVKTIQNHAKKLYPDKIKQGITTLYSKLEVTEILYSVQSVNYTKQTSKDSFEVVTTEFTEDLMIQQGAKLMQRGFEVKVKRIEAEKEQLKIRLSEAEEWYSVKRVRIETGKNYNYRPLLKYSQAHRIEVKKSFDANYGEVNLYHANVWYHVYGLEL